MTRHRRAYAAGLFLVIATGVITAAAIHGRGFLGPESQEYLVHYLSDRPFDQIIFDVKKTDHNEYQARELSYVFDYLDARFIELCARPGWVHFLSVVHLVGLAAICLIHWKGAASPVSLTPRWVTLALLLLFVLSPSMALSGVYYRTSKILVAGGVALFLWLAAWHLRMTPGFRRPEAVFFLAALPLPFLDRQGFFFVAAAMGIFLLGAILWRRREWLKIFVVPLAGVLVINGVYNLAIGPALVAHFAGYPPNFAVQKSVVAVLNPQLGIRALGEGALVFLDTVGFFFGSIGPWGGAGLVAVAVFMAFVPSDDRRPLNLLSLGLVAGAWAVVAMNTLMVVARPEILWPDLRRVYFWMPATVVILFGAQMVCERVSALAPRLAWVPGAVFVGLVVAAALALPGHARVARSGVMAPFVAQSRALVRCADQTHKPVGAFDLSMDREAVHPVYRNYYRQAWAVDVCRVLRR